MEDGIQISGITYICDLWITADHKASHCEGRPPAWPRCGGAERTPVTRAEAEVSLFSVATGASQTFERFEEEAEW